MKSNKVLLIGVLFAAFIGTAQAASICPRGDFVCSQLEDECEDAEDLTKSAEKNVKSAQKRVDRQTKRVNSKKSQRITKLGSIDRKIGAARGKRTIYIGDLATCGFKILFGGPSVVDGCVNRLNRRISAIEARIDSLQGQYTAKDQETALVIQQEESVLADYQAELDKAKAELLLAQANEEAKCSIVKPTPPNPVIDDGGETIA